MDARDEKALLHKMADAIEVIDGSQRVPILAMSRAHPFYILFEYLQETRGQNPTIEEICAEVDRIDREYDKGLTMAECVALERMKRDAMRDMDERQRVRFQFQNRESRCAGCYQKRSKTVVMVAGKCPACGGGDSLT